MGDVAVGWRADVTVVRFLAVFLDLAAGTHQNRIEPDDLLTDGLKERDPHFAQFISQQQRVGIAFPDKTLVEGAAGGKIYFFPSEYARAGPSNCSAEARCSGEADGSTSSSSPCGFSDLGVKFTQGQHRWIADLLREMHDPE